MLSFKKKFPALPEYFVWVFFLFVSFQENGYSVYNWANRCASRPIMSDLMLEVWNESE